MFPEPSKVRDVPSLAELGLILADSYLFLIITDVVSVEIGLLRPSLHFFLFFINNASRATKPTSTRCSALSNR